MKRIHNKVILLFTIFPMFSMDSYTQNLPRNVKGTVIETADGMILAGMIEETTNEITTFRTDYGLLTIPLHEIIRVDGDTYDSDLGIIREHSITLQKDGSTIFEYTIPVSRPKKDGTLNILVPGKVLQVKDLDGRSLPYFSKSFDSYSRCQVTVPTYRLPAIQVKVQQENVVQHRNNTAYFSYRYTPQTDQLFRLHFKLPASMKVSQATPDILPDATGNILWERSLKRQHSTVFEVSIPIP